MGWIAVGLSADLLPSMAMPGRVTGTDLAIWRAASGQVHIWGDRCPHRGMRLSHGFVRDETLSCIYHGWQYGADGGCNHIPAHPALIPPKSICATTYACAEQDGVSRAARIERCFWQRVACVEIVLRTGGVGLEIEVHAAHGLHGGEHF